MFSRIPKWKYDFINLKAWNVEQSFDNNWSWQAPFTPDINLWKNVEIIIASFDMLYRTTH